MTKTNAICSIFLLALLVSSLPSSNNFLVDQAFAAEEPAAGDTEGGEPEKKKEGEEEPDC